MTAVQYAAIAAVIVLAGVALLQVGLALGAPLGRYAWGGRHCGVLPTSLRVGSLLAAPALAAMAAVLLARAGLGPALPATAALAWVVTGLLGLSALGNLASASRDERRVMGPISVVLTLAAGGVALWG